MADERHNDEPEVPAAFRLEGDDPSDVDLGADPALLEPWEEVPPEIELARARTRLQLRGVVFLSVVLVAVWSIFGWPFGASTLPEVGYFLNGGSEPVDLGDLRARRAGGQKTLDAVSNSYVSLQNLVMTYEAESDTYNYFFCPLYNIITRTERELPEKEIYRSVGIPTDLLWLVEDRLAFAEDLTAGFSGEGRLLRADEAPRFRFLYEAYARTVTNPIRPEETWIFLDGETPKSYGPYAAGYLVAILLVFMTGWFFVRAFRVYRKLQEAI